mmetsp:Transcript_17181/g.49850  ORF Transcript_17181/g.49850 Transcript_17181/m.49850 type:complete len:427 (+) Transcript_17181:80-1360(+)
MQQEGVDVPHLYAVLKEIVMALDSNEDGQLTVDEFKPAFYKLNPTGTEEQMHKLFNSMDKNKNGSITMHELATHYGFTFTRDGKLQSKLSYEALKTDAQVLELFQLKAIAADMDREKAKQVKDKKEAEEMRKNKAVHAIEVERRSQESRHFSKHALFERADSARKLSVTAQHESSVIPGRGAVQKHSTQTEIDFLEACTIGDWEAVDKAISDGISVNTCDEKGQSALHKVCRVGGQHAVSVCSAMARSGVELDYPDKMGKTAMHYACEYNHADIVEWLLVKGADPSIPSLDGWTSLHEACFKNSIKCIELICVHPKKPDINARDTHGRTCLHIASYRCDTPVLEYLVSHGADPNIRDETMHDPADLAARSGRRNSRDYLEGLKPHAAPGAENEKVDDLVNSLAAAGVSGELLKKHGHGRHSLKKAG